MSSSKWVAFKNWFFAFLVRFIPETSKRFVLYELHERYLASISSPDASDYWNVPFKEIYKQLKD